MDKNIIFLKLIVRKIIIIKVIMNFWKLPFMQCNSFKWMKTSCKVLNLKVQRVYSYCLSNERVDSESLKSSF